MLHRATGSYDFDTPDDSLHELVVAILLSKEDFEIVLTQGEYYYKVRGGEDGYLCYRKGSRDWVLVANWCFYGLYIVVRYRKPAWLRPMYRSLFNQMNFTSLAFGDNSIELVGKDGELLRGSRLRLSPPCAFRQVMTSRFGYTEQEAEALKVKLSF